MKVHWLPLKHQKYTDTCLPHFIVEKVHQLRPMKLLVIILGYIGQSWNNATRIERTPKCLPISSLVVKCSLQVRGVVGSIHGRVIPKTITVWIDPLCLTLSMREGLMSQVVVWLIGGYVVTASVAQMGAWYIPGPPSQDLQWEQYLSTEEAILGK